MHARMFGNAAALVAILGAVAAPAFAAAGGSVEAQIDALRQLVEHQQAQLDAQQRQLVTQRQELDALKRHASEPVPAAVAEDHGAQQKSRSHGGLS